MCISYIVPTDPVPNSIVFIPIHTTSSVPAETRLLKNENAENENENDKNSRKMESGDGALNKKLARAKVNEPVLRTLSDRLYYFGEKHLRQCNKMPTCTISRSRRSLADTTSLHSYLHSPATYGHLPPCTCNDLKRICNQLHLKKTGNYEQLWTRIYLHLVFNQSAKLFQGAYRKYIQRVKIQRNKHATRIQSAFRRHLVVRYIRAHGPALRLSDRARLCQNDTDFCTMDEMKDIPLEQFISIRDKAGCIYGFDIQSLHHLYCSQLKPRQIKNPYTNTLFPANLTSRMNRMIRLGNVLRRPSVLYNKPTVEQLSQQLNMTPEQKQEMEFAELNQYIHHESGHYIEVKWWMHMQAKHIIYFDHYINILFLTCTTATFRRNHWRNTVFQPYALLDSIAEQCQAVVRPAPATHEEGGTNVDAEADVHTSRVRSVLQCSLLNLRNRLLESLKQYVRPTGFSSNPDVKKGARERAMHYILMAMTMVSIDARRDNEYLFESALEYIHFYYASNNVPSTGLYVFG